MTSTIQPIRARRSPAWYLLGIFLSCLLTAFFLDLPHNPLSRVWGWDGDFTLAMSLARGAVDHGWYLTNPDLGAPFGMQTYDFPQPEATHYLLLKILAWLFPSAASPINPFYLLSFPLTTFTAMFLFRRCGFTGWPAIFGALIYTFLHYHFARMGHIMLANYWPVPLACLLILKVAQGEPVFIANGSERNPPRRFALAPQRGWAFLGYAALCALIGTTGAYYAAFTCFFLAMAAPLGAVRHHHLAPLVDGAALLGVIILAMLLNLSPNIIYSLQHGPNPAVAHRESAESEVYGLKITQLVLPHAGNRISPLSHLGHKLDNHPLTNENATATLGISLSLGFLTLIGAIGFIMLGVRFSNLFVSLSILNLAGLLFATIGGFGAIWALVYPQIRALNRISVFIALFATLAVVLGLDKFYRWMGQKIGPQAAPWASALLTFALLALALTDQIPPKAHLASSAAEALFQQDKAFVGHIESVLPPGAMVFQLPYMQFPENGQLRALPDYDPLRMYLVSHQLRFSYGVIKGRAEDAWMRKITDQPPEALLNSLALAGYTGIIIDARGYSAEQLPIAKIAKILQLPPTPNASRDHYFFNLRTFAAALEQKMGPAAFAQAQKNLLNLSNTSH